MSYDDDEACVCIKELDSPGFLHRVVALAVSMAIEKGSMNERKLVAKLLQKLYQMELIDNQQLAIGLEDLVEDLPTLTVDSPIAPAVVGYCIACCYASKCLVADDICAMEAICRKMAKSGDGDVAVSFLAFLYDTLFETSKDCEKLWEDAKLPNSLDSFQNDQQILTKLLSKTNHASSFFLK